MQITGFPLLHTNEGRHSFGRISPFSLTGQHSDLLVTLLLSSLILPDEKTAGDSHYSSVYQRLYAVPRGVDFVLTLISPDGRSSLPIHLTHLLQQKGKEGVVVNHLPSSCRASCASPAFPLSFVWKQQFHLPHQPFFTFCLLTASILMPSAVVVPCNSCVSQ